MIKASINTVFVEDLIREDNLLHLAVFMRLKSLFRNSCIYKATYANLSKRSGMSVSFLKRHIPFFKAKGWVRMHSKTNMTFVKVKDIDNTDKKLNKTVLEFIIEDKDTYKRILKKIKLLLVRISYNRFEYIKKLTTDLDNPQNSASYKRALKAQRNGELKIKINEREQFNISNQTIGRMIGASRATASRLMTWGYGNAILKKDANITVVSNMENSDFLIDSVFFSKQGTLLHQGANFIQFL